MGNLGKMLWCGCDDSNHKGQEGHEIILATFSVFNDDGVYKDFRNRKRCRPEDVSQLYSDARRWMKDVGRDYRFAAIERDRAVMSSNIPWVLPTLVRSYLANCQYNIENMALIIDGSVGGPDRKRLKAEFPEFPDLRVRSVIKKSPRNSHSRPRILRCPKVLWTADIWANMVYREGVQKNIESPKRVAIP
jgi:hypothetical protein